MENWSLPSTTTNLKKTSTLLDLYNNLDAVWKNDTWEFYKLPFADEETLEKIIKWNGTRKLEFNKSEYLNSELKLVIFNLLSEKKWTIKYLSKTRKDLYILFDWLDSEFNSLSELLSNNIEHWKVILRTFMVNQRKYKDLKRTMLNSKNEIKEYPREPLTIYMLNQFYKTIVTILDDKKEIEKDVWDIRKLKKNYNESTVYFASKKCRELQRKMQSVATQYF